MVVHQAAMDCLVEHQDVNLASDWVVVCNNTRDNWNGGKHGSKAQNANPASSIMDKQATAAQHCVVSVHVKINKRLGTMLGFHVQLCNFKFNSSHSGCNYQFFPHSQFSEALWISSCRPFPCN